MLLSFRCENFRSFKEEAFLSMLPVNAYKEHPENLAPIRPLGANADGVLSTAAIYGANASGKTNLLKAIDFSRCVVLGLISPGSPEWSQSFIGNDSPTCFEYSIITNGVRYTYFFSIDSNGIVEEELRARPKGERLVFRRALGEDGYSVTQGSSYAGIKSKLKGFLDKGPVLKLLSSYGLPDCSAVFSWFEDGISIINRVRPVQFTEILEKLKNLDEESFQKVIKAVGAADLGITGAQLTVSELTDREREQQRIATDKIKAIYEALTGQGMENVPSSNQKITFQFQHVIDGRKVGFGFEDESTGTLTMLNLAADFIDAIACGKTLFVDEIERSLHPLLLKALVGLFLDRKLNTRNAQLVFTTHDLSFLDNDMLRRDQIWFVEKNIESGGSELYPLSSYSPRKDDNILNRYLYGAYGALPFVELVRLDG
ncbi:MAG: ATP/GTP-binding protein [Coriobacteriales bacterium]